MGIRQIVYRIGCCFLTALLAVNPVVAQRAAKQELWQAIAPYFSPPDSLKQHYGDYRPVWKFYDGSPVESKSDWQARRKEIKDKWHSLMGQWPAILQHQSLHILDTVREAGFTKYHVQFHWLPNELTDGYLLVPHDGPPEKPAVITVFYEPETAIGQGGKPERDFARQLTERGFITLSIGSREASQRREFSLYYPSIDSVSMQPLSALAYAAANAWEALAKIPGVDSSRIGIMGHSFGGKWAMFASCLYDKFACAVWSDPGIVFDNTKGSGVNYWEPWYLGYYPPPWEGTWDKTGANARGLYPRLLKDGFDLHELHALMAPRPFLVSGGSSDPPVRWVPLNQSIRINQFLGYKNRVAMTNRPEHSPNAESNRQAFDFLEFFLMVK